MKWINDAMNMSVKAALLSGLVFPGTGQVVLGRRARGFAIAGLFFVSLVFAVVRVIPYAVTVADQVLARGGGMDLSAIFEAADRSAAASGDPLLNCVAWFLIFLWFFSIIDAWIIGKKSENFKKGNAPARRWSDFLRDRIRLFIKRFKELNGDPHYVALGMAVGVFVAFTPTIPFHTILGVLIAFLLRGSKSAAALAVWLSNPLTIPLFYYAEYKAGCLLLGRSIPFDVRYESVVALFKLGWDVMLVMMAGGVFMGIIAAFITYFITRKIARAVREKAKAARTSAELVK